jgi:HIV Tat-specific factor 1
LIAISPYDQQPRIKIYFEEGSSRCKGDCTICYNAEESVKLALDILHEGYIRPNYKISVTRATFEAQTNKDDANKGSSTVRKPASLSQAQVKVAKNAAKQALAWNEDDDSGVSRTSALKIIVLQGMFQPNEVADPAFADELERDIASECEKFGPIEKITLFSKNPKGIVVIKFGTSFAAQECIRIMNGRFFAGRKIKCFFWDGVTNYSIVPQNIDEEDEEEKIEKARLDEFGDWLDDEQDELPEEFQLRTE